LDNNSAAFLTRRAIKPEKVEIGKTEKVGDTSGKNIKRVTTPVDNYYLKGFEKRKDEIAKLGGVRAVQQMLKDAKFDIGKYDVDGKWGQNTEDAY
jgi:hypothetical protein